MKTLRRIFNRLITHWQTTVKAIVYAVLLYMYYKKEITTSEWITATGSILVLNSLLQKDPDKVQTKPEVKAKETQREA